VDYITRNGWTPCLEFSEADGAYVKDVFTSKFLAISIDLRVYICPRKSLMPEHICRLCASPPAKCFNDPYRTSLKYFA